MTCSVSTEKSADSPMEVLLYMTLYSLADFRIFLSLLLPLLLSHFSHVWLCVGPQMAAHQAPPSLGFSRQEHRSGLPFPSPMHEREKGKWSRSVMSDFQQPHGLQPTRLLHPWDFPGKNTIVGCHCLLWVMQYIMQKVTQKTSRESNIGRMKNKELASEKGIWKYSKEKVTFEQII